MRGLGLFVWNVAWALTAMAVPTLESVETLTRSLDLEARAAGRRLEGEEILTRLFAEEPELARNFVLMYDTRSRQSASYAMPRVIAHTRDGRFAIAFAGNPAGAGYFDLEMYAFVRGDRFQFRRILLEPRPGVPRMETTYPAYKPVNEPLCLGCHGADPRPNWEAYSRWEGAYPSDDYERSGSTYALGNDSGEHAGFDQFYTHSAGRGRYSVLKGLEEQFLVPRHGRHRVAPSQFTQAVGYLNYRRLARLIRATPDYSRYKYAILAALYDCDDLDGFLPRGYAARAHASLAFYTDDTKAQYEADTNRGTLEGDHTWMGKLRYLFEGRGISMRKWSPSFRRSPYALSTPGGSVDGFVSSLLIEAEPELEPYRLQRVRADEDYGRTTEWVAAWNGSAKRMAQSACALLRRASRLAFGLQ